MCGNSVKSVRHLRWMFGLIIAGVFFFCVDGCQKKEPSPVPTAEEYKKVLNDLCTSTDGAEINIMVEVGKFEAVDDEGRRNMYSNALRRLNYAGE